MARQATALGVNRDLHHARGFGYDTLDASEARQLAREASLAELYEGIIRVLSYAYDHPEHDIWLDVLCAEIRTRGEQAHPPAIAYQLSRRT